jgi:hypothetical protein
MTTEVKTSFGSGGAGLAPGSSSVPDLATILRGIIDDIGSVKGATVSTGDVSATAAAAVAAVATGDSTATAEAAIAAVGTADVGETYGVADGFIVGAPTTPSSQAVDPGGETDWNVNVSAGYGFCNGVGHYHAAQVDLNVSTGVKIMNIGQGVYAWIVLAEAAGVVTWVVVLGVAAAWGAQTIPTDGDITTGVGHARWTKVALCLAHRTADAAVTTTEDPSPMKKWGGAGTTLINELKTRAGEARTLANDLRTKYNAAVTLINELKTRAGESKTLTDELKNDLGEARALANALKAALNAVAAWSQTVVKG